MRSPGQGFTILEIAVIVAIVSLVVGGIVVGQSIIRHSELHSVISDVQKYIHVTKQFKDKYRYLPGDFPNAESFWGSDIGCPSTASNVDPKVATCNGTGNGKVGGSTVSEIYERFRYWQHLSNAGLMKPMFTGVTGSAGTSHAVIGLNVPRTSIDSVGISEKYLGADYVGDSQYFSGEYRHFFIIGKQNSTALSYNVAFTANEMSAVDAKKDDGRPGQGMIKSFKSSAPNAPGCATTDSPSTAEYASGDSALVCVLLVRMGF